MPLVEVNLWSGLKQYVDGQTVVTVEAETIGSMLRQLGQDYPRLEPFIEAGVSVAIDGRIMANDLTASVSEENEIYLLQQLKGG